MPKAQETVLEIDLRALKKNFEFLKSKIENKTAFLAVVKANGYGHGAIEVARFLEGLEVDYFAVAYTQEGIALRNAGITSPILVLHPQLINFKELIDHCLEPNLYNFRSLKTFIKVAENKGQKDYPVHLKFNTGLNRLGFQKTDIDHIIKQLKATTSIKVVSVFSHLAASEDLNETTFTMDQINQFTQIADDLCKKIGYKPLTHQLNTSGILNYPEAQFDMVRSGIGLFGFGNDPLYNRELTPITTLKSVISQIHEISPEESVGYNRAFKASQPTRTATVPLGHADGIGRQYGNGRGHVLINGKEALIVGNVCMDMLMVDVSKINCSEGDEVIVFGKEWTASKFSAKANTISYEILTALSQRVKRRYIYP